MATQINPSKLLLSKWTATKPQHKEKHFLVTKLLRDEMENVVGCLLEAVLTGRSEEIDWRTLKNESLWRQGWV